VTNATQKVLQLSLKLFSIAGLCLLLSSCQQSQPETLIINNVRGYSFDKTGSYLSLVHWLCGMAAY